MQKKAALLFIVPLLLFFGCAAKAGETKTLGMAGNYASNFSIPQTSTGYTAKYTVSDSGAESAKTVWRAGGNVRIGIAGTSGAVDVYLLGNRGYSCGNFGAGTSCFAMPADAFEKTARGFLAAPDFSSAREGEEVDIGNAKGKCWFFPFGYGAGKERKMCFTSDWVVAWDEYEIAGGKTHTEYLTDLTYSVDSAAFSLPAEPQAAQPVPEN